MNVLFGNYNTINQLIDYFISLRINGNISLIYASIISLIIGGLSFIRNGKPVFTKIMLLGILCDLLRAFFVVSSAWVGGEQPNDYNTSTFAHIGVFIFLSMQFLSLPKPQIDKKGKLISIITPCVLIIPIGFVIAFQSVDISNFEKVIVIALSAISGYSIYNALTYINDKSGDENTKLLKKTNYIIIIYAFASAFENYFLVLYDYTKPKVWMHIVLILAYALQCAMITLLPLVTAKEVKKWKI